MEARCPKCETVHQLTAKDLRGQSIAFISCTACGDTFFFDRLLSERMSSARREEETLTAAELDITVRRDISELMGQADTKVTALDGSQQEKEAAPEVLQLDPAAYPPRGELTLYCINGRDRGHYYQVSGDAITFGRARQGITLHDPEISRRHAQIDRYGPGAFFLQDLQSTNGTFINEAPVRSWRLQDNDLIRMGKTVLLVRLGG